MDSNTHSPRSLPIPRASDFFVPTIPSLPDSNTRLTVYAGHLPARDPAPGSATGTDAPRNLAHLYFLLLRARHTADKKRLIIWFNGGPGCSSFDGAMMEIGAWRPDGKGGLEWTKEGGAWNEYADVLFLDQPVGTGFSYVTTDGYARTLPQTADEVIFFLRRFLEVFPEFADYETWLAGESYAGQYIPYVANALVKAGMSAPVQLAGMAIGNGFIDPRSQYGSELDMMVEAKIWEKGSKEYNDAAKVNEHCQQVMKTTSGTPKDFDGCESLLSHIIDLTKQKILGKEMCINIYDVRLSDTAPACGMNWPPTLAPTYEYLHRPDVRKALHANDQAKPEAWVECNNRVSSGLSADKSDASVVLLPGLLEKGIKVMLFAGDQDLICNHIGIERLVDNLQWGGAKGLGETTLAQEWVVNNTHAGTWRSARNLTYVSVAGASHMVGFDVPVVAHDMMLRFMDVDLLSAAGASARVPSRVGEGNDRLLVIGGGGAEDHSRPMIPGVDGKTEEQVIEDAKWAAYYNAGSAALVVLLLGVGVGIYILIRLRRKARSEGRLLGRGGGGGIGGVRLGGPKLGEGEEEPHELEHLVVDRPGEEEEEDYYHQQEGGAYRDMRNGPAGAAPGSSRQGMGAGMGVEERDAQVIYDVGENPSDEDGEEEEDEKRRR